MSGPASSTRSGCPRVFFDYKGSWGVYLSSCYACRALELIAYYLCCQSFQTFTTVQILVNAAYEICFN